MVGERQHAAGHDARRAGRGGGDDDAHGGRALKHGHGAGYGFGLDGAHQVCAQIVAACGVDEFCLAADKPAERALRCGDGRRCLLAHDLEYAAHGGDGVLLAGQAGFAYGHDGANVEAQLGAGVEELFAIVEDFLGGNAGGER